MIIPISKFRFLQFLLEFESMFRLSHAKVVTQQQRVSFVPKYKNGASL